MCNLFRHLASNGYKETKLVTIKRIIMSQITVWVVVSVITLGIYKLFELIICRKERLLMIEKVGDKLDPSLLKDKLNPPLSIKMPSLPSLPFSFSALKFGCLFLGIGVGLLVGYIWCVSTVPGYLEEYNHYRDGVSSLVYTANVMLFGGLGLVVAFIIELKISRKSMKELVR